jgi:hypothetical protein
MSLSRRVFAPFDDFLFENYFQPANDWVEEKTNINFYKLRGYCYFLALLIAGTGFFEHAEGFELLFFFIILVSVVGYVIFVIYPIAMSKKEMEDFFVMEYKLTYFANVNVYRKRDFVYRMLFAAYMFAAIAHFLIMKERGDFFLPASLFFIWSGLYFKSCLPSKNRKIIVCDGPEITFISN